MSKLAEKLAELDRLGSVWADAVHRAELAEHNRKIVLARVMIEQEAQGVKAGNAQERNARASAEYQQAIVDLAQAKAAEIQARTKYQNQKTVLSIWQTQRADRRAELQALPEQ